MKREEKVNKIFVYGTLDENEVFSDLVRNGKIKYVGEGRIRAKLYDLGEYPGAVEHEGGYVYGKVYDILDVDKILPLLDEYEDFNPSKPASSLFVRKTMRLRMEDRRDLRAFVYLYNRSVHRKRIISTGIWKKIKINY